MSIHRRWWFRALTGIVTTLGISLGWLFLERHKAKRDFDAAVAQLDAADPGWRLAEIEAARQEIPNDQNGAIVARRAVKALSPDFERRISRVAEQISETPPQIRLSSNLKKRAADRLAAEAEALRLSRSLIDYPRGRFAVTHSPDAFSTIIADQSDTRKLESLLTVDCYDRLDDGDLESAVRSIRALLNLGRCLQEDPFFISQMIRMSQQRAAVRCLERVLAQGELPANELERLQRLFADEAADECFLVSMRGDRAALFQSLQFLLNSDMPVMTALGQMSRGRPQQRPESISLWEHAFDIYAPIMVHRSSVWALKHQTKVLEAAQKPGASRYPEIKELESQVKDLAAKQQKDLLLATKLIAAYRMVAEMEQRIDTLFHCAVAGLAAERFRLKTGRWPDTLQELFANHLLPGLPEDLYSGEPLRLTHEPDGLLIDSTCRKLVPVDMEGRAKLDPDRVEFRLWDVDRRRQPAKPDDHDWIVGRWRSTKFDAGEVGEWQFASGVEFVIDHPDEVEMTLVFGEDNRETSTHSLRLGEKSFALGPEGSRFTFDYRKLNDDTLSLVSADGEIHIELHRIKDKQ
jgi:hypothetical protein